MTSFDTGFLGSIGESARRIVKANQPLSNDPQPRSGHPRLRATLRGKKGMWLFLSSSNPKTRGSRKVSGGVAGYRGCPVCRQPFILLRFHPQNILRYSPTFREGGLPETGLPPYRHLGNLASALAVLGSCASPYDDVIMDAAKVYTPLKGSGRKEGKLYGRPSFRGKRLRRGVECS
jgi:hypothetical protein